MGPVGAKGVLLLASLRSGPASSIATTNTTNTTSLILTVAAAVMIHQMGQALANKGSD